MKRYLPFLIILFVLVAGLGVAAFMWKKHTPATTNGGDPFAANPSAAAPSSSMANGTSAPANSASPNLTNSSAGATRPNVKVGSPVVIEEYGDYQCPPCGQLYPELKQIEREYGNQVQVVFHHFPLMKIHKNALIAAQIG